VDGIEDDSYDLLAHRYGHAAGEVLALAAERDELRQRIVPDLPDLLAEAPFSARNEQAQSVGDVLLRRTRLGLLAGRQLSEPGADAPRRVAEALAPELGWDAERVEAEVARFYEEAQAEGIGA
jgi:glycerol-3-phosphate dehydrogenase